MCRRGGIRGHEVGAIDVGPVFSVVHVASAVAEAFARAAREPDPRDPRVLIRREGGAEARALAQRAQGAAPRRGPKPKPRPRIP